MLKQIIYRSRWADGLDPRAVIEEILAVSRRSNPERGITGGLATLDGLFVQILEGEANAVDDLLLRLYRDGRHSDLRVVSARMIPSRMFETWAMAHAEIPGADLIKIGRVFHDPYADPDVMCELMLAALGEPSEQSDPPTVSPIP